MVRLYLIHNQSEITITFIAKPFQNNNFLKHPFLKRSTKLSTLEQEAINLESRYERMVDIWLTKYPDKVNPSKVMREVHDQLNNLWKQIKDVELTKRKPTGDSVQPQDKS